MKIEFSKTNQKENYGHENIVGIKRGSISPGGVKHNQSVFDMALANQEQHTQLDTYENKN